MKMMLDQDESFNNNVSKKELCELVFSSEFIMYGVGAVGRDSYRILGEIVGNDYFIQKEMSNGEVFSGRFSAEKIEKIVSE